LESFDFCGPQSRAKISHARWTSFSHINWYKKCRAFHKDIKKSPGILAKGKNATNTVRASLYDRISTHDQQTLPIQTRDHGDKSPSLA